MPGLAIWRLGLALGTHLSDFHHFGESLMEPMDVLEVLEELLLLIAMALGILEIAVESWAPVGGPTSDGESDKDNKDSSVDNSSNKGGRG